MDESQVAEQLKQKLPESKIDDSYPAVESGDPTSHSSLPLENMLLERNVADFLGLPSGYRNNPELLTQLTDTILWAVDTTGSRDFADIAKALARKQGEMGISAKEDKLSRLYRSIKINKQIDGLFEQMRSLRG